MRKLVLIVSLFIALRGYSQTGSNSQSFPGVISMPVMQTVKAEIIDNSPINFDTPEEIENGKLLKSYCRITVISNVPWVVKVRNNSAEITDPSVKTDAISNMISVKSNTSNTYVPLSGQSMEIFKNSSNAVVTTFYVDVRIKPSVITKDGRYGINLFFTVSPQ